MTLYPPALVAATRAASYITKKLKEHRIPLPGSAVIFSSGIERFLPRFTPAESDLSIPLQDIPGFEALRDASAYPPVPGHRRALTFTRADTTAHDPSIVGVCGRIHLYEGPDPEVTRRMVRLLVDMLLELGVKFMLITSVVGSCTQVLQVGQVGVCTDFLNAGERLTSVGAEGFPTLKDAIQLPLWERHLLSGKGRIQDRPFQCVPVTHQYRVSSTIEGAAQKAACAQMGAHVVGASGQPELECVARWRQQVKKGAPKPDALFLAFVTNGTVHSTGTVHDAVDQWGPTWGPVLKLALQARLTLRTARL